MRLMASAPAVAGVVAASDSPAPSTGGVDVGVRPTLSMLIDTRTMWRLLSVLHNRSLHRRAGQAILDQHPTAATAPVCS
jgi:hypothetical protein